MYQPFLDVFGRYSHALVFSDKISMFAKRGKPPCGAAGGSLSLLLQVNWETRPIAAVCQTPKEGPLRTPFRSFERDTLHPESGHGREFSTVREVTRSKRGTFNMRRTNKASQGQTIELSSVIKALRPAGLRQGYPGDLRSSPDQVGEISAVLW